MGLAAMICLVSITTVWFSFARGLESLINIEVPVEFMNRDAHMEIFDVSNSSVKLQLSGSGALLKSVRADQVKVKLNLANTMPGSNHLIISRDTIFLPPGIKLKQVDPQVLVVNVDVPVEKILPIQADWIGKLEPSLILKDVRLVPNTVKVVGASLMLKNIETIYTEKISLETIATGGTTTVGLVLQPSSLKLKNSARNRVDVIYRVKRRSPESS